MPNKKEAIEAAQKIDSDIPWELVEGLIAVIESDDVLERNWKFSISHPDMICNAEIASYINRQNPIGIVQLTEKNDERKKTTNVFIHESLVTKAAIIDNMPMNPSKVTDDVYCAEDISVTIKTILDWAKNVKHGSWDKKDKPTDVVVGIPKI